MSISGAFSLIKRVFQCLKTVVFNDTRTPYLFFVRGGRFIRINIRI